MTNTEKLEVCPECFGQTILFKGKGKDTQYKVCSKWPGPGHKTEVEINQIISRVRRQLNPSGRFA